MADCELRQQEEGLAKLARITERINYGVELEEVLDALYQEMRELIPYNRIGFSLIDQPSGEVVARWSRSDRPMLLKRGYRAQLKGSTLERIIETMQPRVINDLEDYLRENPRSKSTGVIVREGIRSSLTCPLIVQGKPVGFVFFSSLEKDTYSSVHVAFFQQIAGQLATIVEKGRLYSELAEQKAVIQKQNVLMTRELDMARQVQRALIPYKVPEIHGLEIAFEYEPASPVGGDVLDIIPLGGNRVLFFLGDAMGHGVQAALVMSVVKAALQSAVQFDSHPPSVLEHVNKAFARLFSDRFVTAACCLIDSDEAHAELALAGHAGPLWFRAETADVVQPNGSGLPLGVSEDTKYETIRFALGTGDTLVFSTDGIAEAFDPHGNQYGDQRLRSQVLCHGQSSAGELCAGLRRDLDAHCKGRDREDDLALLVVKLTEPELQNEAV